MRVQDLKDMNLLFHVRNKSAKQQIVNFSTGRTDIEFTVMTPEGNEKYQLLKPKSFKITSRNSNKVYVTVETIPSNIKLTSDVRSDGLNILEFENAKRYFIFGKSFIKLSNKIKTANREYRLVSNLYKTVCRGENDLEFLSPVYQQFNDRVKNTKEVKAFLERGLN